MNCTELAVAAAEFTAEERARAVTKTQTLVILNALTIGSIQPNAHVSVAAAVSLEMFRANDKYSAGSFSQEA